MLGKLSYNLRMSVYLHDIPLPEAINRFTTALVENDLWHILGVESIHLDENAVGRVLAEPIWAKVSSPNYHASAMDGFAVRSFETSSAQPSNPVLLRIGQGACYLDTGDPLPGDFDAIIPIENVESLNENGEITELLRKPYQIRIRAAITPWSYVRPMGEDIVQTQLVLPAGQVLRPVDLGAMAAAGYEEINVTRPPRVAILPTGSELVPLGTNLKPGDILEYNSLVLAGQIKVWGGVPNKFSIIPDDFEKICSAVQEAARTNDLILLNAGSSAGAEDYSSKVIEELGTLLVHGVAVRPGHPVILGLIRVDDSKSDEQAGKTKGHHVPIIGVPGYPVSAALTTEIFVEPTMAKWLGRSKLELPEEDAQLTRKITSPGGDDDYVRVVIGKVGSTTLAAPLPRGAGIITSLVRADGLVILPRGIQGLEAGSDVKVHLYRPRSALEHTIFCIGSHDMTIDLMSQLLSSHERRLVSANVGSQGGLIALKRGEAHMAGSHLLDPETGEYNIKYIHQYLDGIPVRVYGFVGRQQGLMVKKTNPKKIKGLEDLIREDVHFINRQRGAGTRVLLDYHLEKISLSSSDIRGYGQEEYTHLGVAAAVASGRADCGLGIPAAAQSLDLDFIPLFNETFEFVIPTVFANDELIKPVFDVMKSSEFQHLVSKMPGYDIQNMGSLIAEL
jgi:putative molybdopterin biosynthesis protein